MSFNQFNFEHASWLWALLFIPVLAAVYFWRRLQLRKGVGLERFADPHLLPFLVKNVEGSKVRQSRPLLFWSAIWALAVLALAGPRWDFREFKTYKSPKNLVLLLDLSRSMDATDVKPSRLIRAREKIQDLLDASPDVNIGLVGFAADAHLITPITEDKNALRYVLGALRSDVVFVEGSRLAPALKMAESLLMAVPGKDKAVLILSDGGFEDNAQIEEVVRNLAANDITVNTMGLGTTEGGPIPSLKGGFVRQDDQAVLAKADLAELARISSLGKGRTLDVAEAGEGRSLFASVLSGAGDSAEGVIKDWEPRFYIFLIPLMLLLLPLFRRPAPAKAPVFKKRLVAAAAAVLAVAPQTQAAEKVSVLSSLFKNQALIGKEAYEAKDYSTAIENFTDPYRRGVAQYKAGQFADAEKSFAQKQRSGVSLDARYNQGNAQAEQGKYEDAVRSYQDVLKANPGHRQARENLKIVQDLLKKKDQKQAQNQQPSSQDRKSQGEGQDQQKSQSQAQNQDKNQQTDGEKQNQKSSESQSQASQNSKEAENTKKSQETASSKPSEEKQGAKEAASSKAEQEKQAQRPSSDGQEPSPADVQPQARPDGQKVARSQQDVDADQWLRQISSDPHSFLKNQFYIESSRMQTQPGEHPW